MMRCPPIYRHHISQISRDLFCDLERWIKHTYKKNNFFFESGQNQIGGKHTKSPCWIFSSKEENALFGTAPECNGRGGGPTKDGWQTGEHCVGAAMFDHRVRCGRQCSIGRTMWGSSTPFPLAYRKHGTKRRWNCSSPGKTFDHTHIFQCILRNVPISKNYGIGLLNNPKTDKTSTKNKFGLWEKRATMRNFYKWKKYPTQTRKSPGNRPFDLT